MNKLLLLPLSIATASAANAQVALSAGASGDLIPPSVSSTNWNTYQIAITNNGSEAIELHKETFSFVTPTQLYSAPWGIQGAGLNLGIVQQEGRGYRNALVFNSYNGSSFKLKPGAKISMSFGYGGLLNESDVESSFILSAEGVEPEANNKPTVTLTKPESNITIKEGDSYTLSALASDLDDDLEGVKFFINNNQIADDKNAPFNSVINDLDVGTYPVYVHAYDKKGNVTQSSTRIITVEADNGTAPTVNIIDPVGAQEITLGDTLLIAAQANDIDDDLAGVEVYIDGQKLATLTNAPFNYQLTPTSEGLYSFYVVAFDSKGNRTESQIYALKVLEPVVETHPPVISLTSPISDIDTLVGESITISANASDQDNDLKEVRFYRGTVLLASKSTAPFSTTFTAVHGESTLFAEAIDREGNITRSNSVKVTATELTEAEGGSGACDTPQYVNGEQYNAGDRVQNNGSIYVCKQFGWCGQAPYEPGVAWNGSDYWKDAWNIEGSCDIAENIAPTISLSISDVFAETSFELGATVSDEDGEVVRVDYYLDSVLVGSSESMPFTVTHAGLVEGNYQLFAVATDDAGAQTRTETTTITVEQAFEGNRLTLTFPEFSHKDLMDPPAELSSQELTGLLYCPSTGESINIKGSWGETIHTDELKECQYQLTLDGFSGYIARFSPWMVDFTKAEENEITVDALYRAPIDTNELFPLGGVDVSLFLEGIYQPRSMAEGDNMLFVGSSSIMLDSEPLGGAIYVVELDPQTKKPIGTYIVAEGEEPHGVAYRDGNLYYGTVGALYKIENIAESFKTRPQAEKIFTYPADGTKTPIPTTQWWTRMQHQKHPLKFNTVDPTDNKLYTAAGLPCNICTTPEEELYGTIFAVDLDTGEYEIMASGIRNTVGFDWHPQTGEIWFSDNNRQQFANPDEINRISNPGNENFGAPIFFGKDTRGLTDEEMMNWEDMLLGASGGTPIIPPKAILPQVDYDVVKPTDFSGAEFDIFTNSAPLGVQFWDAYSQDDSLQYLVYATHGNSRPEHPGLELRMVTIENGTEVIHERPLVTGWMRDRAAVESYTCLTDACIGRPVEFLELEDGSMLVSDDKAGVLYRLEFNPQNANAKQITFTATNAPAPSVSDELISGALVHPNGHESKFHMAWGSRDMNIDGLENGTYQVRLNDVGDYIPEVREYTITISDSNRSDTIVLNYIEKPVDLVGITTVSVQLPEGVTAEDMGAESIDVTFINNETKESFVRALKWGESLSEELDYGSYDVIYPYFNKYLPAPTKASIQINESNLEHNLEVEYNEFDSGADLIAQNCNACHSNEFFDNPNKASVWDNAGYDALLDKIMSMPVAGHCDRTCAEEIADYLFDEVWNDYLNATDSFGNRQVRLLTSYEYSNSVKDLFNVVIDKDKLPKDKYEREFKFAGQANHGIILPEDMKQFHSMAVDVATRLDLASIGYSDGVNKTNFVNQIGLKVYRRPLDSAETSRFVSFLTQYGARDLVAAMLLSPNYLYRSELGTWNSEESAYELSQYELATALSYSFLGTTPNTSLLTKASKGELNTDTQIADQVASMMQSEKGIKRFTDFIGYYINTKVEELPEKPGLTPDVVNAMVQEQVEFIRYFLTEGEGTLTELFNPNFTFVNRTLAEHYGIDGVVSNEFEKVGSKEGQRGGLLHQGLTQVVNSDYAATSLVKRGLMIRQNLLCRTIGVPVDVDPDSIELPDTPITTRERWDTINGEFASAGQCWECHQFMNDTGASLENYSQTGEWRTEEPAYNESTVNLPIDASGPLRDNTGMNVVLEFENARDISAHFPSNTTVMQCLADSYFRYAMGTEASAESTAGVQGMTKELEKSGSIHEMLKTLATSHMFKFKKEEN